MASENRIPVPSAPPLQLAANERHVSDDAQKDSHPSKQRLQPVLPSMASSEEYSRREAPQASSIVAERVPLHRIYNEQDQSALMRLYAMARYRLYDPPSENTHASPEAAAPAESNESPPPVDFLRRHRHREQDTVGAMLARLSRSSQSSRDQEKGGRASPSALHRTESAGWYEPWSFKNCLGEGSNEKEVGNTVFGPNVSNANRKRSLRKDLYSFLWQSPMVPLVLRVINISMIACTLGITARVVVLLRQDKVIMAAGASPYLSLALSPPSLVYAVIQIWIEFHSQPIGLWKAQAKLWFMMIELLLSCFWSAELALAFDNYYTSMVQCVEVPSFYLGYDQIVPDLNHKDSICGLQLSHICVCFVSVMVYILLCLVCHRVLTSGYIVPYIPPGYVYSILVMNIMAVVYERIVVCVGYQDSTTEVVESREVSNAKVAASAGGNWLVAGDGSARALATRACHKARKSNCLPRAL